MIKEKYLNLISEMIIKTSKDQNLKFFIFGSSLKKKHFGDVDLGVVGKIEKQKIRELKEDFENSTLPYFVDIINFNEVSTEFKNNVFNNDILWIKH